MVNARTFYPEYYLIEVERFQNIINNGIDEWVYFFKNSEIKDDFHSKNIQQAREKLDVLKMSEEERRRMGEGWRQARREYPRDKCVHQLFEEQVERTPEAVAVVYEGASLTYRELNGRANQLAHRLRELGVGPDVLVGLCAERSLEMIVGLLGILKAGGAYLPLDPHLPTAQVATTAAADYLALLSQAAC